MSKGGYPQISHIKFLPGGEGFAATTSWRHLGIWSLWKSEPILEIRALPDALHYDDLAVYANGGKALIAVSASSADGPSRVDVYDEGGNAVSRIENASLKPLVKVQWTQDGSLITTDYDSQVTLWQKSGTNWKKTVLPVESTVRTLRAFSTPASNDTVAVREDGSLHVLAQADGRARPPLKRAQVKAAEFDRWCGSARTASLSPQANALIAGTENGYVLTWRIGLEPWPQSVKSTNVEVPSQALVGVGEKPQFCGIVDNVIKCWSVDAEPVSIVLPPGLDRPDSAAFDAKNGLLAGSYDDGRVVITETKPPNRTTVVRTKQREL